VTTRSFLFDTSGLIAMARLGMLEAIQRTLGPILVTPEVLDEATVSGRPGATVVHDAAAAAVVVVEHRGSSVIAGLGLGESSTITASLEYGHLAVIDDMDARRVARKLGVDLTGTVAILVRLTRAGVVSDILDPLDRLEMIGFRLSPDLRRWAIDAAAARPPSS
jgi:predicted nucleic acid-binding protein